MKRIIYLLLAAISLVLMAGVPVAAKDDRDDNGGNHNFDQSGMVYTITNLTTGNQVVAFARDNDGKLKYKQTVSTHGTGTGAPVGPPPIDPLASQNSIVLTDNGNWLLACNAGSNEITVFRVKSNGLEFVDKENSGGTRPTSLTVNDDTVFVLNNGGTQNVVGFKLNNQGHLSKINGSTRNLGAGDYGQVSFDPRGNWLVVTDKAGSRILVFDIGRNGLPAANAVVSPSLDATPFDMVFDNLSHLLVVSVNNNNGAVSSYRIRSNGTLDTLSASVANGQGASCWITSNNRGLVYTTNPGSQSISSYRSILGNVSLLNAQSYVNAAPPNPAPGLHGIDAGISDNGKFLYTLDPVAGGIAAFQIQVNGSLVYLGTTTAPGIGLAAQGLAVG